MTPAFPPARILALAAIFALLLVAGAFLVATHQPWLGIEFKPNADNTGLVVVRVHSQSPNRESLVPGDVVIGLRSGSQQQLFEPGLLPLGEYAHPTFAVMNRYVAQHDGLWKVLTTGNFDFILADGSHAAGSVAPSRPGADLPFVFWALAVFGVAAFLIGIGIWVFRPQHPAAPAVFIGVTSSLFLLLLEGVIAGRELTLSPFWLRACMEETNFFSEVAVYALVALLWYYPSPRHRFPFAASCSAIVVLVWLNEIFQVTDLPFNTYMLHYLLAGMLMVGLSLYQWHQTRHEAASRAALQWYLLSVVISSSIAGGLVFLPMAFFDHALAPKYVTFFTAPLIYFGFVLGIARYRLFDLERWWLEVWLWLGGGLLVIGIDVLLITFFQLADLLALGFALILAGWVYLPLRQWLFRRVLRPGRTRLDDHFPLLIETLFRDGPGTSFGVRWHELVKRVFLPMNLKVEAQPAAQTALAESGLSLQVPSFGGDETYKLHYREQGRRLYTPRDVSLADSLLALTRRAAQLWQQREEGVKTERTRIMRDLHDDVAARLLSFTHHANEPDQVHQAREALSALHDVIYALDEKQPLLLADLVTDLEAQLRERARNHGIEVDWQVAETLPAATLGARAQINLTRILTEAASNAIRHGTPTRFVATVWMDGPHLHLSLCNNGARGETGDWVAGKGLNNIRNRIQEIGGEVSWNVVAKTPGREERTCCMELQLTVSGNVASEP